MDETSARGSDPPLVSLFIPSFRGGGAEGAVVRLANELERQGVPVEVVSLSEEGPWGAELSPSVARVSFKGARARTSILKLVRYLQERRPAVLVSNLPHLSVISVLAVGLSGSNTRLVILEHNDLLARLTWEPGLRNRFLVWAMRATYPRADKILAVSYGAARNLSAQLGLPGESVGVMPNGIDVDHLQQLAGKPNEHPWLDLRQGPVFLGVGRLVRQKGFDLLIETFASVASQMPARLIIIGEGNERSSLLRLAERLNVREKVDLIGYRSNPYPFMREADAFILSSRYEGFGVVLLEALAAGCPIVSFDCPSGPSEVLDGGSYGLLVQPGDLAGLAQAMIRVASDRALAQDLITRGRSRAAAYDISVVAAKFITFLEDLGVAHKN